MQIDLNKLDAAIVILALIVIILFMTGVLG
jgi:hypothetical protein